MLSHARSGPFGGPWPEMWAWAATGPDGFWRRHRVGTEFRTAAAVGIGLADAVCGLLDGHPEIARVVELGAGDGELIGSVADRRRIECVGVDLRPGPEGSSATWLIDRWDTASGRWRRDALPRRLAAAPGVPTLMIMNEWLDELPVTVLTSTSTGTSTRTSTGHGLVECRVDRTGREQPGAPATEADRAWVDRWWSGPRRRVEVGRPREQAWVAALRLLTGGGLALMIDYGHRRDDRPPGGSLRGYAAGRAVDPVPDGRCNLTCDVAVDAVRAAGERAGAVTLLDVDQSTALERFVPTAQATWGSGPPARSALSTLSRLAERSSAAALMLPGGFGRYRWLLQEISAGGCR